MEGTCSSTPAVTPVTTASLDSKKEPTEEARTTGSLRPKETEATKVPAIDTSVKNEVLRALAQTPVHQGISLSNEKGVDNLISIVENSVKFKNDRVRDILSILVKEPGMRSPDILESLNMRLRSAHSFYSIADDFFETLNHEAAPDNAECKKFVEHLNATEGWLQLSTSALEDLRKGKSTEDKEYLVYLLSFVQAFRNFTKSFDSLVTIAHEQIPVRVGAIQDTNKKLSFKALKTTLLKSSLRSSKAAENASALVSWMNENERKAFVRKSVRVWTSVKFRWQLRN